MLRSFFRDRSGNFAILTAALAVPLVGSIGVAVDYARLTQVRSVMQNHLDAAVLEGVRENNERAATTRASGFFSTYPHSSSVHDLSMTVNKFDNIELEAEASANVDMSFMRLFGFDSIPVRVRAAAARNTGFQELVFAVDLSGSLGMGATPEDRAALEALTQPYTSNTLPPRSSWYAYSLPQGCAFACHRREGWEPDTKTVYNMAREAGIRVREDELIAQFSSLTDLLLSPKDELVQEGKRTVTVIAFSNNARKLIDKSKSASAVKGILNQFSYSERYETVYSNAFKAFGSALGTQGQGTKDSPAKMLIMITDGIESRDAFHSQKAIDTKLCDTIKAKGFPLAVVELKYPKIEKNYLYDDTVKPVETKISSALESCASPGWYFQAGVNEAIPEKFHELKEKFGLSTVRLTQ